MVAGLVGACTQIVSIIILARLLMPEDYGVVTMVFAVTGFAQMIVDLGTREAVVQQPRITESEMSALFWITMAAGVVASLLVTASGPLLARLYDEPRLATIAALSSLSCIAAALSYQHGALLRRAMMFKEIAVVQTSSSIFGALSSILLACIGFGYWALVARPIATIGASAIGTWYYCRWIPGKPRITAGVKDALRFGVRVMGFTVVDQFSLSIDKIAIGLSQGVGTLGYYQKMQLVYGNMLSLLSTTSHGVASASLSKLRTRPAELRKLWAKALSTITFFAMPAFGVIAVISEDLVVLLLGHKWAFSGLLLGIFALRGIPHCVERTLTWLHTAGGRADRLIKWGAISLAAHVVALCVGVPYGAVGVVTAYVICMYFLFVPAITYAGKPLGIQSAAVVKVVWPQLIGALSTAGVCVLLRFTCLSDITRISRLYILFLVYSAIYTALVVGVFRVRFPIAIFVSFIRRHCSPAQGAE